MDIHEYDNNLKKFNHSRDGRFLFLYPETAQYMMAGEAAEEGLRLQVKGSPELLYNMFSNAFFIMF